MIEIHVLSLTIGIVVGVMSVLSPSGLFNSFRPWRKRIRPWPSRLVRTRTGELRRERRNPPRGESALPAVTCDRCHKYSCVRKGSCSCLRRDNYGGLVVPCKFTCPAEMDEPPVPVETVIGGRVVK